MKNITLYNMDDTLFSEIINNNKQEDIEFIENIKSDIKKNKMDVITSYYNNICSNMNDNEKQNLNNINETNKYREKNKRVKGKKIENERNKNIDFFHSIQNEFMNETYTTEDLIERNEDICCICGTKKTLHYKKRHKFFKASQEYKCVNCGKYFFQHNMVKNPCFSPLKRL